jgi:transposase InsO family protein
MLENQRYYQFTAIDCASRWRHLKIYKELIEIAPFRIRAVKTDNGSHFTNRYTGYLKSTDPINPRLHDFDLVCQKENIIHYLIDPGKPRQNGKVERSHREDQEKLYDLKKFKTLRELERKLKVRRFNNERK